MCCEIYIIFTLLVMFKCMKQSKSQERQAQKFDLSTPYTNPKAVNGTFQLNEYVLYSQKNGN